LLKYSNYPFFSRWWPSTILDWWGKFWDDPQQEFCGVYHCAKFGWNRISRFDNTKVLIFSAFGLKMPIHASFLAVFG